MIRARFELTQSDPRPIEWPINHPYWCTGYGSQDCPIIVAYADNLAEIERLWPDAELPIDYEEATEYSFTSRFPKPDWLNGNTASNRSAEPVEGE